MALLAQSVSGRKGKAIGSVQCSFSYVSLSSCSAPRSDSGPRDEENPTGAVDTVMYMGRAAQLP